MLVSVKSKPHHVRDVGVYHMLRLLVNEVIIESLSKKKKIKKRVQKEKEAHALY